MTHSENRTTWIKEGLIGLGVGVLYGVTNVCVGHPFDTVKTKMQAQVGFEKGGMFGTFTKVLRTQGIIGLYRGAIPPLLGSGIFRSTQFGVFESVYTFMNNSFGKREIPFTGGIQNRVIVGGVIASTARAIIECPLEYIKIRKQTGQSWIFKEVYLGFGVTWCRTIGLMTSYFIFVDSGRRHLRKQIEIPFVGPFLLSGVAATAAWWIIWPLEYMKSQVQGNYGQKLSVWQRVQLVIRERGGFLALYRGIMPGSVRSFLANGVSMVVMMNAQKVVTKLGIRNSANN